MTGKNVSGFIKANWGVPFILGFMILLMSSGVFLSLGYGYAADEAANYAFYSLIAGLLLRFLFTSKYNKITEVEVNI